MDSATVEKQRDAALGELSRLVAFLMETKQYLYEDGGSYELAYRIEELLNQPSNRPPPWRRYEFPPTSLRVEVSPHVPPGELWFVEPSAVPGQPGKVLARLTDVGKAGED